MINIIIGIVFCVSGSLLLDLYDNLNTTGMMLIIIGAFYLVTWSFRNIVKADNIEYLDEHKND